MPQTGSVTLVAGERDGDRSWAWSIGVIVRFLGCRLRVTRGGATYTPPGYGNKMHDATKTAVAARLKRIEGQVGGVLRMIEDERYCVDILTQINAIRAALHKVEEQILHDHVSHCVAGAFASGDPVEQRHKVDELVETIGRMTR
jgi:CsoR family transcriptional regulator, copper-sensing transcriptional repressor